MAELKTKDFSTLVREQATAIQGSSSRLLDLSIGSILRAVVEANAGVVLWIQSLILKLLTVTRASTSTGIDLDTWVQDYGIGRLEARPATGLVTLGRASVTPQSPRAVVLALGLAPSVVQTSIGAKKFVVVADVDHPDFSAPDNGYVLAQGEESVTVPVEALVPGSGSNVVAGAIDQIVGSIPGVDTVENEDAFDDGRNAETDVALRARFVSFIGALSKGTKVAVGHAILSLRQGLDYTVTENEDYVTASTVSGTENPGYFYVVFDDGSGEPSDALKTSVENAIEGVRPLASTFAVFKPAIVQADVSAIITAIPGTDETLLQAELVTALRNYIASLKLGEDLRFTRIGQVLYDANPTVTNVSGITLNGSTSANDLVVTQKQLIKPDAIVIAVNA